jgi:hypothetical protein
MLFLRRPLMISVAAAVLVMAAFSSTVSASWSHGPNVLHATKECSQFTGQAGSFCTFTSSNLPALKVGSRIIYASAAGATGLDTDVLLDAGHGTTATGHCALDFATGLGTCTFWKGTGHLAGFHASVTVSYLGGPDWAWVGTYRFIRHHCHGGHR